MANQKTIPQKFECIDEAFEFVKSLPNQKVLVLKSVKEIWVEKPDTLVRSFEKVLYKGFVNDCILVFGHREDS